MKKIAILLLAFCLLGTTNSVHAEGPIFVNKVKSLFSSNKTTSNKQQAATKPVSVSSTQKASTTQNSNSRGQVYTPPPNPGVAARKNLLNQAHQRSEYNRQERIAGFEGVTPQTTIPQIGGNNLNPVPQGSSTQTKKKIVVRKKENGDGTPKPIFKNFR